MNRNGLIEIYRFLGALVIVADHVWAMGILDFPCAKHGYPVIFFFFLTGFLTMRHYDNLDAGRLDLTKDIWHKFGRFIPYTAIAIIVGNIIMLWSNPGGGIRRGIYSIFEILMLSEIPMFGYSKVNPPLWQMSSMLICFPIAVFLIRKMRQSQLAYWIAIYGAVIGVDSWKYIGGCSFPIKQLICLSFIIAGAILYDISKRVDGLGGNKAGTLPFLIKAAGITAFLGAVLICYFRTNELYGYIFLSVLCIVFSFTKAGGVKGTAITNFLGEISVVIYIIHYDGVRLVNTFFRHLSNNEKVKVYFLAVLIFTMVAYGVVILIGKIKNRYCHNINNNDLG